MAFTHLFSVLLLSFLLIASATASDYGSTVPHPDNTFAPTSSSEQHYSSTSTPKLDNVNPDFGPFVNQPEYNKPEDLSITKPNTDIVKSDIGYPKPDSEYVKPNEEYSSQPNSDHFVKPEYENPEPKPDQIQIPEVPKFEQPQVTIPYYGDVPQPKSSYTTKTTYDYSPKMEKPLQLGVEGVILCKSGSTYLPLEGAVARITCSVIDESDEYKTTPFSCLTGATDAKGYFFQTLPHSKLTDCKVKLDKSPSKTCFIPTDVNKGITGVHLSSYRILSDKGFKLYSVAPLFYTSEPTVPTPKPGY